eukprot:289860-Chlamydomonas_euryale.AAC.3
MGCRWLPQSPDVCHPSAQSAGSPLHDTLFECPHRHTQAACGCSSATLWMMATARPAHTTAGNNTSWLLAAAFGFGTTPRPVLPLLAHTATHTSTPGLFVAAACQMQSLTMRRQRTCGVATCTGGKHGTMAAHGVVAQW